MNLIFLSNFLLNEQVWQIFKIVLLCFVSVKVFYLFVEKQAIITIKKNSLLQLVPPADEV